MGEENPIDEIEHRLDIDEAATAADSDELLAGAKEQEARAKEARDKATTSTERLAAHIAEMDAVEDQTHIKAADSKADWELGQMTHDSQE